MSFDYSLASLNLALFWISRWPPLARAGAESLFSRTTAKEQVGGTAEEEKSMPKTAGVKEKTYNLNAALQQGLCGSATRGRAAGVAKSPQCVIPRQREAG